MSIRFPSRNLWIYIFLISAFLNAVLKSSPDSDITFFRLLLPFAFVLFFVNRESDFQWFLVLVAAVFALQFWSLLLSEYPISFLQVAFMGHYLTMIFMFFLTSAFSKKAPFEFYRFLRLFYIALVLFLAFQYFIDFRLPNTNDRGLNGWYWNQNDASLALAGFFILALRAGDTSRMLPVHLAALIIMAVNDSRAALWGSVAYVAIWYLSSFLYKNRRGRSLNGLIVSVASTIGLYFVFLFFNDRLAEATDQLMYGVRIVLASESGLSSITSVGVRSQAMVYALEDFARTYGLGTGAGNSIAMLQINSYSELTLIKSIHNMPIQMLLELGLPLLALLTYGLWRHSPLHWIDFASLLAVYGFVSLTQSGGFMVNYFPLVSFYFCLLMPVGFFASRRRAITQRATPTKYRSFVPSPSGLKK